MPAASASSLSLSAVGRKAEILARVREYFVAQGYSGWTMDDLARELGMSKKTLYVHFAGKDALLTAMIEGIAADIREEADGLLAHRELTFAEKLHALVLVIVERLSGLRPETLAELERFAPALLQRIQEVRGRTIPYVFGRFVEAGQLAGFVRPDPPPAVAIEFFLQAMQGLMQPASLQRLRLEPEKLVPVAIDLFFGGLLTPLGRRHYEKEFAR